MCQIRRLWFEISWPGRNRKYLGTLRMFLMSCGQITRASVSRKASLAREKILTSQHHICSIIMPQRFCVPSFEVHLSKTEVRNPDCLVRRGDGRRLCEGILMESSLLESELFCVVESPSTLWCNEDKFWRGRSRLMRQDWESRTPFCSSRPYNLRNKHHRYRAEKVKFSLPCFESKNTPPFSQTCLQATQDKISRSRTYCVYFTRLVLYTNITAWLLRNRGQRYCTFGAFSASARYTSDSAWNSVCHITRQMTNQVGVMVSIVFPCSERCPCQESPSPAAYTTHTILGVE